MENKTKKEEGFADFIDGIEDVVTLTPSASSPFSETLSQPEPDVEPATKMDSESPSEKEVDSNNVTLPEQSVEEGAVSKLELESKPEQGFNVKQLFFVCLGLFGVSSLGALLSHIVPIFGITIYLWYIAVGVSLISVVVLFFAGVIKGFSGKSFEMVGYAVMFLVVLGVVGFGTCMLNMSGM
jgi:hypothetical protein